MTRLLRRDIVLSTALSIVAVSRGVSAPALLQKSVVRAALGVGTDSQASALAESVLKGMFLSKLSTVTALVVSLALAASSVLALVHRDPSAEAPASEPPEPAEASVSAPRVDAFGDPLPPGAIARLGTVRFRQGLPIEFLSFTPDGKRLFSHGGDGVRIWDSASGKQLRHVVPNEEATSNAIDLSPDGKLIAVAQGGRDKCLQLWDADSGRLIASLETKYALHVRFAPDGRLLAVTANNPGGVELWDVAGRKKLRACQANPPQFVERLAFSADSRRLLTTARDKRMRLWDVDTGRKLQEFSFEGDPFDREPGVLSPDGKCVAIIEANHKREPSPGAAEWVARISLWDATSGKRTRTLTRPTHRDTPFSSVTFTADGKRLLTGGPDQFLRVWDPATGKELRRLPFESGLPHVLALSPDGNMLAAAVYGGRAVRMVNLTDGKERTPLLGHQAYINAAVFSPDGRLLAVGSQHNHAWATDDQGKIVEGAKPEHYLMFLDLATGCVAGRFDQVTTDASSLAFSPDSRMLAWGGYNDPTVHLLEVAGVRERHRFVGHRGFVFALTFSADGHVLLSGSSDTTGLIWDLARRPDPRPAPSAAEMEKLWNDLDGEDAARAYEAIVKLAAAPDVAAPFLRRRVRPVPSVNEKYLARLITDLDDGEFATRQKAIRELEKLGDRAVPAYCRTLEGKPSIETRRRLEDLLEKSGPAWWDVSGERLRSLRAVEVLELAGTKDARETLATLAGGAGGARLTEQAKAALERLANRMRK